jgi:ABC-type multidrug transport system ATPase subunit
MLKFEGICVDIGHKKILRDVSGSAKSWEILAIMGPSGCGKSTLLNSIAGYLPVTKGTITLDGKKMDKSCRSKMSYVFQADLFFEELTLRETLMYTAQLRLPYSCGFKAKKEKVEKHTKQVIDSHNTYMYVHTSTGGRIDKYAWTE